MKNLNITTLLLFIATMAFAQPDPLPESQIQDSNNLRVRLNANGALFTDFEGGRFSPKSSDDINLNLLESLGFWIMGVDNEGVLRGAIQKQNEGGTSDWFPGHFTYETDSTFAYTSELNQVYTVYSSDVNEHLADFKDNGIIDTQNVNVFSWPGVENWLFELFYGFDLPYSPQGLSGYWDEDNDGRYDPSDGDFPVFEIQGCETTPVAPTVMSTFYINDESSAHTASGAAKLNQQIIVTVAQFRFEEESALNNTVFVRYKVINHFSIPYPESITAKMAINADFAIGDKSDDYFGTNEARQMAFAYNSDNEDELFGENPPVIAMDMLRGFSAPPATSDTLLAVPLERVFSLDYADSNQSPTTSTGFYNLMNGFFPNGVSVADENYQYGDSPFSEGINSELSLGNAPGARSALMVSEDFIYQRGAVNEVILALTYTEGGSVAENLDQMIADNDEVQAFFDNCFTTELTPITNAKEVLLANTELNIYPNPAKDFANIVTPDASHQQIELYDITGRLLQRVATDGTHTQINVEPFTKGSYIIKVKTEDGIAARHLVVQ